ncbi:MAG TPA: hypothetical protein VJH23_06500 [archaeon]|nr:hypothetical protein [archaeon]
MPRISKKPIGALARAHPKFGRPLTGLRVPGATIEHKRVKYTLSNGKIFVFHRGQFFEIPKMPRLEFEDIKLRLNLRAKEMGIE